MTSKAGNKGVILNACIQPKREALEQKSLYNCPGMATGKALVRFGLSSISETSMVHVVMKSFPSVVPSPKTCTPVHPVFISYPGNDEFDPYVFWMSSPCRSLDDLITGQWPM